MCVAAFAWRVDPAYPLIAIGNRDELHARPAAPLDRWADRPIIAGRDRDSGGTWLGMGQAGRFALVTNLREATPVSGDPRSRGLLVVDSLLGEAEGALAGAYRPFNLLHATPDAATLWTNRPDLRSVAVKPGLHGLSNGPLESDWGKTRYLKRALDDWARNGHGDAAPLFAALARRDLPAQYDGGPPFILDPIYGTRCSTVCAMRTDGSGWIIERRFAPDGTRTGQTEIAFPPFS